MGCSARYGSIDLKHRGFGFPVLRLMGHQSVRNQSSVLFPYRLQRDRAAHVVCNFPVISYSRIDSTATAERVLRALLCFRGRCRLTLEFSEVIQVALANLLD